MEKTIKSVVFCIVLGIASTQIYAENKIRFGVKGGVNASTTLVSLSEYEPQNAYKRYDANYKYNAGFNAGILVEFPLINKLSFQPELLFSTKGMRNESFITRDMLSYSGIQTTELHAISKLTSYYIECPLYLKAHLDLNKSGRFIAGLGPYFAYGLSGRMKTEFVVSNSWRHWRGEKNIFKEDDLIFNESTSDVNLAGWIREPYWRKSLKRFDGGVSAFIGYEFHEKWFTTITYDIGLVNFLNSAEAWDGEVDGKMYNRTFSISLGYKF
ncbi:hypothetical protein MASR2M117_17040 [Paludibacter sp.]